MTRASQIFLMLMVACPASAQVRDVPSTPRSAPPSQVRDVPATPDADTAVVSGSVVDDRQQPVRRVVVRLEGGDLVQTAVTESDGRFQFDDLPAGRFILSASKPGYIPARYGARRPGRSGTTLALAEAARVTGVSLIMMRGAVITGVIADSRGEPAPAMSVRLLQSRFAAGGRSFVPVTGPGSGTATTDDRGVYRFYGLEPGDYMVGAMPPRLGGGAARLMTNADIERAVREMRAGSAATGLAGRPSSNPVPQPEAGLVTYAAVYYPGTTVQGNAGVITLQAGEERAGVDFRVDLLATVNVDGAVVRADGLPPGGVRVALVPSASAIGLSGTSTTMAKPDGSFALTGVLPGEYVATAMIGNSTLALTGGGVTRAVSFSSSSNAAVSENTTISAISPITVSAGGISGLTLTMGPGLSLTGRLAFDGSSAAALDPSRVNISLSPRADVTQVGRGAQGRVDASGAFTVLNLLPGRYLVNVTVAAGVGAPPGTWTASSVVVNGQEVVDSGLDVTGHEATLEAVITLTNRLADLNGLFQDTTGQPVSDYTVVLFTTDQSLWRWQSRRIKAVRPSSDGRYVISGIPAGDYLLTAVNDVEPNEWFDPDLLAQLLPSAIRLTIAQGENKQQDIRTRAIPPQPGR